MYPSIQINLAATASRGPAWAVFGISLVLLAAASIHEALECEAVAKKLVCCILAMCFLAGSCGNAIVNISARGEDSREDVSSQNEQIQAVREDRNASSQALKELKAKVGSATVESIEADIQAKQAEDANRWKSTEGCNPDRITAGPSRTFCAEVARLRSKLADAKGRDKLKAHIEDLDRRSPAKAEKSIDPFADTIAEGLQVLGYAPFDAAGKKRIAKIWEWTQAILLEMIGAFGPAIFFSLLMRVFGSLVSKSPHEAPQVEPQRRSRHRAATPVAEPENQPVGPSEAATVKDHVLAAPRDAFLAAATESMTEAWIEPAPFREAWLEWCGQHNIEPGNTAKAKGFNSLFKTRVRHNPNSGRPRYEGIRFREKAAPRLRAVT